MLLFSLVVLHPVGERRQDMDRPLPLAHLSPQPLPCAVAVDELRLGLLQEDQK
jgi:hypothetical protein